MNKLVPVCETVDKNEEYLQILLLPFNDWNIETYVLENDYTYTICISTKYETD